MQYTHVLVLLMTLMTMAQCQNEFSDPCLDQTSDIMCIACLEPFTTTNDATGLPSSSGQINATFVVYPTSAPSSHSASNYPVPAMIIPSTVPDDLTSNGAFTSASTWLMITGVLAYITLMDLC